MANEEEKLLTQVLGLDCPPDDTVVADQSTLVQPPDIFQDDEIDLVNVQELGINTRHIIEADKFVNLRPDGGVNVWFNNLIRSVLYPYRQLSTETEQTQAVDESMPRPGGSLPQPTNVGAIIEDSITNVQEQTPSLFSRSDFLDSTESSVDDPFRWANRKCWSYFNNRLTLLQSDARTFTTPRISKVNYITDERLNVDTHVVFQVDPDGYFTNNFTERDLVDQFVYGTLEVNGEQVPSILETNKIFYDHYHQLEIPFNDDVVERYPNLTNLPNVNVINSKSLYNFYSKRYERTNTSNDVMERHIFSPYSYLATDYYLSRGRRVPNSIYNFLTLDGLMDSNFFFTQNEPSLLVPDGITPIYNKQLSNIDSLYDTYSTFVESESFDLIKESVDLKNKNLLFSNDGSNSEIYKLLDRKYGLLGIGSRVPFSSLISFKLGGHDNRNHCSLLAQEKLTSNAMRLTTAPDEYIGNEEYRYSLPVDMSFNIVDQAYENTTGDGSLDAGKVLSNRELKVWDAEEFMDSLDTPRNTFEGFQDSFTDIRAVKRFGVPTAIRSYVQEQAENHTRGIKKIFDGVPCKSETLFYKISKSKDGEVIQNIFLPIDTISESRDYIDAQVKLGQEYDYEITAFQIVYGTAYQYDNISTYAPKRYRVRVRTQPSVKIIEVPFASFSTIIYDAPPLPPKADLYSYFSNPRKLTFFLTDGLGKEMMMPITMTGEEETRIDIIRRSQERPEGHILYKSDDTVRFFQIFRTTTRPTSYDDFVGYLIDEKECVAEKTGRDASSCKLQTNSVAWTDERVKLDTKYYYMFRSVDIHGSYSNPSPIMEVELRSVNTTFRVESRVIDLEQKDPPILKTSMNKFLKVAPSSRFRDLKASSLEEFEEELIGAESGGLEALKLASDALRLGRDEQVFWNTDENKGNFKIRLTSKKTGKKIDLILNFKEQEKSAFNIEPCGDVAVDTNSEESRLRRLRDNIQNSRSLSDFLTD